MLSRLIASIRSRGAFFANVATMVTGAVAARLLGLAALPFLSRLFTPEEFGVLALFTMVNIVASTMICWGYEPAIVLPDEDAEARQLLRLCLWLSGAMALCMFLLAAGLRFEIAGWLNNQAMATWILLCPLATWCIGAHLSLRYWSARQNRFAAVSRAQVGATAANVGAQLTMGFGGIGAAGLVIGQALGRVAAAGLLMRGAWGDLAASRREQPLTWPASRQLLSRYQAFPRFYSWSNLLYALSTQVPVLMLNLFFSASTGGLYFLAQQLLSLPVEVVAQSVAQVFYPKAREAWAQGNAADITLTVFKRLLGLGLTPMCLLLAAPEAVSLVLGEQWYETGVYIAWLSGWFLTVLVSAPMFQLFEVLGKQNRRLVYQALSLTGSVIALLVGGYAGSAVLAVALFGVTRAVITLSSAMLLMRVVGVRSRDMLTALVKEFALALPFIAAILAVKAYSPSAVLVLVGAVLLALLFAGLRGRKLLSKA